MAADGSASGREPPQYAVAGALNAVVRMPLGSTGGCMKMPKSPSPNNLSMSCYSGSSKLLLHLPMRLGQSQRRVAASLQGRQSRLHATHEAQPWVMNVRIRRR